MRKHAIYRILILSALFLNACLPAAPGNTTVPSPTRESAPQVLVLWTHDYLSYNEALKNKWIPEFEAAHPGVKIQYEIIPYSGSIISFDSRLLAEVSSGGGPDVWAMASHNFIQFDYLKAGLLAPLDPQVFGYDSVEDIVKDYPAHSLDAFLYEGKIYALLNELTTLCLFYNKTMFDAAGVPYLPENKPVSWRTIKEISQKILKLDANQQPIQMGYQFGFFANYPAPEWYIQNFYPFMRQYGQDDLYINGQPAANTPAIINAFQQFYDFTHTYQAYNPYFIKDWFSDFSNQRVSMVTAGSWYPSVIRTINENVAFGVAPHPVVDPEDTGTYQNIEYSFGWVVNGNSSPEKQKLSQEFLAFILGKKGESAQPLWWMKNIGFMQPRKALLNDPEYQAILGQDSWLKCFLNTFETYQVSYYQHSADEAGSALVRAVNRVVYNKMTPRDTAELLQNELLLIPPR